MIQLTTISLMAEDPVWDPNSSEYDDQESYTMKYRGEFITCEATPRGKYVINSVGTCDAAYITDAAKFGLALEN